MQHIQLQATTKKILLIGGCLLLLMFVLSTTYAATIAPNQSVDCGTLRTRADSTSTRYTPPFSIFAATQKLLVRVRCDPTAAEVTVGTGAPTEYIYETGYERVVGGVNRKVTFTGNTKQGKWIIGSAKAIIPQTSTRGYGGTILVYLCEKTSIGFKCGCRDAVCTTPAWMMQKYSFTQSTFSGNSSAGSATSAASAPTISSISPSIVTSKTQTLLISGKNFTKSGNTVLVSSDSPDKFTNIASIDGKTITISLHSLIADEFQEILKPFKVSGHYDEMATALAASIKNPVPGYTDTLIPINVSITNTNGKSANTVLLINVTKILEEIKNTMP